MISIWLLLTNIDYINFDRLNLYIMIHLLHHLFLITLRLFLFMIHHPNLLFFYIFSNNFITSILFTLLCKSYIIILNFFIVNILLFILFTSPWINLFAKSFFFFNFIIMSQHHFFFIHFFYILIIMFKFHDFYELLLF